jgi:hypothetical protein
MAISKGILLLTFSIPFILAIDLFGRATRAAKAFAKSIGEPPPIAIMA